MKTILTIVVGMLAFSVFAQKDTLYGGFSEIVIHEQRLGIPFKQSSRSIDIVTAEVMAASSADNVAELLNDVAGVDVRQRGPHGVQSDVGIRGGNFDQTLILINGIKLSDPQTGHHNMNIPVAIEDIERIEVLKGPAARIYGANGFSGAINIVTKKPNENSISVGVHTGDYQLLDTRIGISNTFGKYGQSASYSRNASDGYKYNTDYEIEHYTYQGSLGSNGNQLNLLASHSSRKFGANGFYASPDFMDQYEETHTSFVALDYSKLIGGWYINPKVSYRRNKDDYVFLRENPSFFNNVHISEVLNGELQARSSNPLGIFQIGAEYNMMNLESNNLGVRERNTASINAEQRILLMNEKLDITPGVSYSYFSDLDAKIFPGLDIGYRINNELKVFGNAGYTFRVPTYTDLYYESSVEIGNEDLQAEEALSIEVGAKYDKSNFTVQIALFSRQGNDLIDWSKSDSTSKWQPINIGDLTTNGIEFSTQWRFHAVGKFGLSNIGFNYTLLDTDQSDVDALLSRYTLEHVKHQFAARFAYHVGNIHHNIQLRYVDRVNLEDYTVVDSKLYYDTKEVRFSLNVNNLFDEIYRETNLVELPGRWVSVGADIKIGY